MNYVESECIYYYMYHRPSQATCVTQSLHLQTYRTRAIVQSTKEWIEDLN